MQKHKVTFQPAGTTLEVSPESYPYGRQGAPGSLLDIALAHGVRIECACGGQGVCGTCHVIVTEGSENLSEADEGELDMLDGVTGGTLNSRLACQAVVQGDVTVTIPAHSGDAGREKQ